MKRICVESLNLKFSGNWLIYSFDRHKNLLITCNWSQLEIKMRKMTFSCLKSHKFHRLQHLSSNFLLGLHNDHVLDPF